MKLIDQLTKKEIATIADMDANDSTPFIKRCYGLREDQAIQLKSDCDAQGVNS